MIAAGIPLASIEFALFALIALCVFALAWLCGMR